MSTLNLKIAELRKREGWTQQELGERIGVSFQTVSKWENEAALTMIVGIVISYGWKREN